MIFNLLKHGPKMDSLAFLVTGIARGVKRCVERGVNINYHSRDDMIERSLHEGSWQCHRWERVVDQQSVPGSKLKTDANTP